MKNITIENMVWPVENYTDKINGELTLIFKSQRFITFTIKQLEQCLLKKLDWLTVDTSHKKQILNKLINTGIRKLIQANKIKEVTSNISVEKQWIATDGINMSSYVILTEDVEVAKTDKAMQASSRRCIGFKKLQELNETA